MGTLATELSAYVQRTTGPRIYADANLPAGVVAFMRHRLRWDVLYVLEHDELRRASDVEHYRIARQLQRTLVTIDRDYLDDRKFPPAQGSGVLVVWAPDERLLTKTLARVNHELFAGAAAGNGLPLIGRKLVADTGWSRGAGR